MDKTNINIYLKEIAERLWTGHASIMIGAGFSVNATNIVNRNNRLPNWNQLGDIIYKKLYGKDPDSNTRYLNILKLAEEYQAVYGRNALDQLIKKHIADGDYEPSEFHTRLMELPWSDVFTTNYDTLLERSCENVLSRRYDIVVNQEDLIHSSKPRIIKLHGSLPSTRPLIVTEEDYRIYPKRYAPFVNTVQQSLLENTLCLLGFSGDDPNFLKWVGWINDNIGKENAPKIYLIGVLNLTDGQTKLLHSKNIITVDLATNIEAPKNHKKGLTFLLEYLENQKDQKESLLWPKDLHSVVLNEEKTNIQDIIKGWRKIRKSYPNWTILPYSKREKLWHYTVKFAGDSEIFRKLTPIQDLEYLYELNWRLEKCLFPIWNNMATYFQKVLDQYNLFSLELDPNKPIDIKYLEVNKAIGREALRSKWIDITLSLLRLYREEKYDDEWRKVEDQLNKIFEYLSPDQVAHFYYERVLYYLFQFNHSKALRLLNEWQVTDCSPFWETKRANLLIEFGLEKEAKKILETTLTTIRKRLNLSQINNDYTWLSHEAYVMFLLKTTRSEVEISKTISSPAFNERQNFLRQYLVDPWDELNHFNSQLSKTYYPESSTSIKEGFKIGSRTRSIKYGGMDKEIWLAYNFLRFTEEIGIPLSSSYIDVKIITGALKRLSQSSSHWVNAILSRYRDHKAIEQIFDREYLDYLNLSEIDSLVGKLLGSFDDAYVGSKRTPITRLYIEKIPKLLSRLCSKCSENTRKEIFHFLIKNYHVDIVSDSRKELFNNLLHSFGSELSANFIIDLLNLPIDYDARYEFDPFDDIKAFIIHKKVKLPVITFNNMLNVAKLENHNRQIAVKRLMFLYKNKVLNASQEKRFFNVIWSTTEENTGFPKWTPYYYFAFGTWPHPENIDPQKLYKKYIAGNNFNIQSIEDKKGISLGRGEDRYAAELLFGSSSAQDNDGISWTQQELTEILSKCETWWSLDKHYLSEEKYKIVDIFGSIHEEFFHRFIKLGNILGTVFSFQTKNIKDTTTAQRLKDLVLDMEVHGIPVITAKVLFGYYTSYKEYLTDIQKALKSESHSIQIEALNSTTYSTHDSKYLKEKAFIPDLIKLLTTPLDWNVESLFMDIFDTLTSLIKRNKINYLLIENSVKSSFNYVISGKIREEKQISFGKYLEIKQSMMQLGGCLHLKYTEARLPLPSVILDCIKIAENQEEFGDIRSSWYKYSK
jgi:hypothetical protein